MANRILVPLLYATLVVGVVLALSSSFLISVEYDEAWIATSHYDRMSADSEHHIDRVLTTGGLHALIVGFLSDARSSAVEIARVVSLVSMGLLLLLVERLSRKWFPDFIARSIILVFVLGTPGSLILAGMGYGVVLAATLVVAGWVAWLEFKKVGMFELSAVGLVLGAALATRWTFLPLLPFLVLAGMALSNSDKGKWKKGLILTAITSLVVVFFVVLLNQISSLKIGTIAQDPGGTSDAIDATGLLSSLPTPARITGFSSRFVSLLNLPIVLIALGLAVLFHRRFPKQMLTLIYGLGAAATLIAFAWVFRSPFLHLRYIWPSLLFINLACGFIFAWVYTHHKANVDQLARAICLICIALPIGLATEAYTVGIRVLASGSGYEANNAGLSRQEFHYDAFRIKREQLAVVEFLKSEIGSQELVFALGLPAEWSEMQLSTLSDIEVKQLPIATVTSNNPEVIVTHELGRISQEGTTWLQEISSHMVPIYGYRFHWVDQSRYVDPEPNYLINS